MRKLLTRIREAAGSVSWGIKRPDSLTLTAYFPFSHMDEIT